MSDVDRSYNLSNADFRDVYRIRNRQNQSVANIYFKPAPSKVSCSGTIFFFHGYAGSPWEVCMKVPMMLANCQFNYNIVAVEGADLSVTSGTQKTLANMTLPRQRWAMLHALEACRDLPELNHSPKIAWAHSLSCRALVDLTIHSTTVREFFDRYVLVNPFFVPPRRVFDLYNRSMTKDPTGRLWHHMINKTIMMNRTIENVRYEFPSSLYNLWIPFPTAWNQTPYDVAQKISPYIGDKDVFFLLGRQDTKAEYDTNVLYYEALTIPHKNLVVSEIADHSFENAVDDLRDKCNYIIHHIYRAHSPLAR